MVALSDHPLFAWILVSQLKLLISEYSGAPRGTLVWDGAEVPKAADDGEAGEQEEGEEGLEGEEGGQDDEGAGIEQTPLLALLPRFASVLERHSSASLSADVAAHTLNCVQTLADLAMEAIADPCTTLAHAQRVCEAAMKSPVLSPLLSERQRRGLKDRLTAITTLQAQTGREGYTGPPLPPILMPEVDGFLRDHFSILAPPPGRLEHVEYIRAGIQRYPTTHTA